MTVKAGLIGYPLGYSLSPAIHHEWFRRHRIDGAYDAIRVEPGQLKATIEELKAQGYAGFNVTVPYKQDVVEFCDTLDPLAQAIGAVNTVVIAPDGGCHGLNTDAYGFAQNLQQKRPAFDWTGKALVLGSGGAARAAVYALKQKGMNDIVIVNRSRDKADELAGETGSRAEEWDRRVDLLPGIRLLINTTSLGMTGKPELELPLDSLPLQATVYDIVYAPLMTSLLKNAQKRGNPYVTGIGMLLHQAAPAFNAWTGYYPLVDDALEALILGKTS